MTFAIWGLIYLALSVFCLYHLLKAFNADKDHEANQDLRRMGFLFILNSLATGAWTIAWVYEWLLVSVFLMLIQLVMLLLIHLRLDIYDPDCSAASRCFTQFPLSIYFGWICIATVANISAALVGFKWNGFGLSPEFWAILMIAVATLFSLFVVVNRRNLYVGLVTIWAFYGIILKYQDLRLPESINIMYAAWVGLFIVALVVLFVFYQNAVKPKTIEPAML